MKRSLLGHGWIAGSILLMAATLCVGCTARVRYYDDYDHDYHYWNGAERGYYHEYWEERHEPYRDYDRLNAEQQRNYWKWRHEHHDRDHDHDHDHDRH